MLETTVIQSRKRTRNLVLLPISVGVHLMLVAGALVAAVMHVELPTNPPKQTSSYSITQTVPLPPPAPLPPKRATQPQPRVEPEPQTQPETPVMIPDEIPELPQTGDTEGSDRGSDVGIPGGDPNGSPDGIPGGVSDLTLPPPRVEPIRPLPPGNGVSQPKIIHRVEPRYPEHARRIKLQGWVAIECIVDRNGRTQNLQVVGSSNGVFEAAAMEALRQWRFTAGTLRGAPVDTVFVLRVNFTLN